METGLAFVPEWPDDTARYSLQAENSEGRLTGSGHVRVIRMSYYRPFFLFNIQCRYLVWNILDVVVIWLAKCIISAYL